MSEKHSIHDSEPSMITLAEAMGIGNLPLQKMVLVLECGCHPVIYLKSMVPNSVVLPKFVEIVKDVFVGDDASVVVSNG